MANDGQQAPTPATLSLRRHGKRKSSGRMLWRLGITEIVLAVISFVLNVIIRAFFGSPSAILLLVCGVLGVRARHDSTRSMYIANFILSSLAMILLLIMIVLNWLSFSSSVAFFGRFSLALALSIANIGASIIAVVVTIVHCCYSLPFPAKQKHSGQVIYQSVPQQRLISVQMPPGQTVDNPSLAVPSANMMYPSNAQPVMAPATTAAAFNANKTVNPFQPVSFNSNPVHRGQTPPFPTDSTPITHSVPASTAQPIYYTSPQVGAKTYYHPHPGQAAQTSQTSRQVSLRAGNTKETSLAATTSGNPWLYGDRKLTE